MKIPPPKVYIKKTAADCQGRSNFFEERIFALLRIYFNWASDLQGILTWKIQTRMLSNVKMTQNYRNPMNIWRNSFLYVFFTNTFDLKILGKGVEHSFLTTISTYSPRARLYETQSELKPLWNVDPFSWQFTWRFHCGNFPNNSKTIPHVQMISFN